MPNNFFVAIKCYCNDFDFIATKNVVATKFFFLFLFLVVNGTSLEDKNKIFLKRSVFIFSSKQIYLESFLIL